MSVAKPASKVGRPSRSIDEEIAAQESKLKQLRDKKREEERKALQRNEQTILALLREHGLVQVSAERWKAAVPQLLKLLGEPQLKADRAKAATQSETLGEALQTV